MTRTASLFVFFLLLTIVSLAAPLRFEPQQVRQPNGSILNCFASGDEYSRRLHDANDYTIIQDPSTGWYVYAMSLKGTLVPTQYIPGRDNPATSGLLAGLVVPTSEVALRRHALLSKGQAAASAPKTGTLNNLVIYIRFSGEAEFGDSLSIYNTMFNSSVAGVNSVRNYFTESSYGQLTVNSTFYPQSANATVVSYQDEHSRGYYQAYNSVTNPSGYQNNTEMALREHTLLMNAVDAISSQIPTSLVLDGDYDGYVDNTTFIIAGTADATSGTLWPHKWTLYMQTVYINGARVYDYNLQLQNSVKTSGVGVLCHELLHTVGVPDMYHYTSNGIQPLASWDVMENNLNPPQHINAYSKLRYTNWISSIPEITTSGTYYLKPATSATGQAYRVASSNPNEYYILEYRRKTGVFENSLPGSGVVIYRINTSKDGLGNAGGPADEVYVYRPSGTTTANGYPSNGFFNSTVGRNKFNTTSNPTPFLSDGTQGGLNITYIGTAGTTIAVTVSLPASAPSATTAIAPVNGAVNVSSPVQLSWNAASGNPTGYKVYVGTDNPPTNAMNGTLVTGTSTTITTTGGLTYFWRIVPTNATGDAVNCPVWNFSTPAVITAPNATTAITPANGATNLSSPVQLCWNVATGDPTGYKVYVGTNNPPTNLVNGTLVTETSTTVQASDGTTYYWRIVPTNAGGDASNCPVWSFSTPAVITAPNATTAIAPTNGAANLSSPVQLSWNAASGDPTGYKVYVGTNNPPTNLVNGTLVTGTSTTVQTSDGTTYYWRIVPTNAGGDASNCPVWSFSTLQAVNAYPYTQPFASVPPTGWSRSNTLLWTVSSVTQRTGSKGNTAKADCWNAAFGARTMLVSETFNISNMATPTLKFYVAHRARTGYSDTLQLRFSTDGGSTWSTGSPALYRKGSSALATGAAMTKVFNPGSSAYWRCETVNLAAFAGSPYLTIGFEAYCGDGNNIFIDDVMLLDAAAPARVLAGGTSEETEMPNLDNRPSVDLLALTATTVGESVQLEWNSSLLGQVDGYTIERSENGVNGWSGIAYVPSEDGMGEVLRHIDASPLPGTSWYRIVVEQVDGTDRQSQRVSIHRNAMIAGSMQVYPTPLHSGDQIQHVAFQALQSGPSEIRLYDAAGQLRGILWEGQSETGAIRTVSVRMEGLSAGVYLMEFRNGTQSSIVRVPVVK